MSSTAKMRRVPSVFAGAFSSALTAVGVWNFVKINAQQTLRRPAHRVEDRAHLAEVDLQLRRPARHQPPAP